MFRKVGQRVVALPTGEPEPPPPADSDVADLDHRLASDAEHLPLAVYLLRRDAVLGEDTSHEKEIARCVLACWRARRNVLRVAHPRLGHVPVFPVDILDSLYAEAPAQPEPKPSSKKRSKPK
jgi:hypothetical protein